MSEPLEDVISGLIELFRPYIMEIDSVVDIGTGTSIPIHIIARHYPAIRYYTVDIKDRRKIRKLPFLTYDGSTLPFDNHEFDVSILNETLHHCADPQPVLTEACRVASLVYIIEHFPKPGADINKLISSEKDALSKFDLSCDFYNPFTEDSFFSLIQATGLTLIDKLEIPYMGKREIKKYLFRLKQK
jgi:SAM-dependent methyltransferase